MENNKKLDEEVIDEKEKGENEKESEGKNENESNERDEEVLLEEDELGVEEITDRLLRLQADFMNYRNRVEKDKKSTIDYATEDLISQMLPVLDNFERALDEANEKESFYEGVKLIYEQFLGVLKKNGLEEIECLGEKFDPNFHHGVIIEECEGEKEGIILEVLQKGYTLNGKVIRPTMVKIAE